MTAPEQSFEQFPARTQVQPYGSAGAPQQVRNKAQRPPRYTPPPPVPQYMPVPEGWLRPPTIALTLVITLLFGIFGAIPAAIHSNRARQMRAPTRKYWLAFWIPIVTALGFGLLLLAAGW